MNRKNFLENAGFLIAATMVPFTELFANRISNAPIKYRRPPYLKIGDTIGITCPAGSIKPEEIQPAMKLMENWGYKIKLGSTIGKTDFTFGGTDEERAADLQQFLNDPDISAIMCARGGYGAVRIIDKLNWEKFVKHPKWIIGFSDATVLLNHVLTNCHMASIHSKMCNSFPVDMANAEPLQIDSINSIHDALMGKKIKYPISVNIQNKYGSGEGILVGGNLKTIESLTGSTSDINTSNKILFVEDTGEYLYSIDRMFWNLKRTGKLKNLKGLIIGGFNVKQDDAGEEFGRTVQDIVLEKVKGVSYPVCFDFPVGHQKANFALKVGVMHKLVVSENEVIFKEIV